MAAAAATAASLFRVVIRRETTTSPLAGKKHRSSVRIPRFAVSVDRPPAPTSAVTTSPEKTNPVVKREEEGERAVDAKVKEEEEESKNRSVFSGMKRFLEESKVIIDEEKENGGGGAPRWFSPPDTVDCSGSWQMEDPPVLLYLPGIDGVGLGLTLHHQKLGRIFDISCMHIPVADRTPFTDLMKIVESRVKSEHQRSPRKPIYLVGESLGACLALAVAARNPDIDLVLILANPATSFSRSQLQLLIPLMEVLPDPLSLGLPELQSLMPGDSERMELGNLLKGLPLQNTTKELMEDFINFSPSLPALADILPKETLLWKLKLLRSASAYANSRLHAVKAQTLILSSEKDELLPSKEEGERLRKLLANSELRKFADSGHFLFLQEGNIDLVTVIKGTSFYRRGKKHDYVSDYIPPTPTEFKEVLESYRLLNILTSPVMLSTLEDGTIVKGLAGLPSEGPVIYVGYHMLLGIELGPLVSRILTERDILVRGIAHPLMFRRNDAGLLPDLASFDSFRVMGAVPVAATNLFKLLSSKSHILLYPGGMREALHRKGEEYKLFWPEQSEFVRMAARFGAKIVPFGTVGEDDLAEVVLDYDDLVNIPLFKSLIEKLTAESIPLRTDATGEVANQQVHMPAFLPKVPGRFYYYFGKPIETEGRRHVLKDREKSNELYLQVKSEVEKCLAYLKEKRESDPYRNIVPRLLYKAEHGFDAEVPTFEI
ncbi:phytyl ester synthase 2, chloroplastic isoform X1 [Arachis hypogaea]|uniref:phytyl ester synthase 2, chloroplastic isoform X1 n=1 Tax=Arachis hypogaea TaxID=3818 RepID=UPI000A2C2489|nr:acyltransferase-like protein At3g26840, chloroplastic isoform X1 [Arachis hypogaea]